MLPADRQQRQPVAVMWADDEEVRVQDRLFRVVFHRLAVQCHDAAAGLFDNRLRGRGIPFRRQAEPGVDVGIALGDDSELERTAHWHEVRRAQGIEVNVKRLTGVRTAADHPYRVAAGF